MTDFEPSYPRAPRVRRSGPPTLLLAGALTAVLLFLAFQQRGGLAASRAPAEARVVAARGDLAADENATIELFERCSKSVVYVSPKATRTVRTIFGLQDYTETGTGSGFIWDEDGHVVTNHHVIQSADSCLVTLPDNSSYNATLVGEWPEKDIAVLHIDAPKSNLFPIAVGSSHDLRVGQKVFAIGNPFGLDFTLTTGIVSALNRQIESVTGRMIQGVIQTDAAINPGNSGGPLLDSAGRLIGMNTMIMSQSGGSAGIGFAVPVDTINQIVPQLIAHGRVIRPDLGIVPADESIARRLKIAGKGVLVIDVEKGSAAERAGLRPTVVARNGRITLGDIILKVGETHTPTLDALYDALERYEVGETVVVTVERGGETQKVSVTLQAVP